MLNQINNERREVQRNIYQILYNNAEKIYRSFYLIVFLDTCKAYKLIPKGLKLKKNAYVMDQLEQLKNEWNEKKVI